MMGLRRKTAKNIQLIMSGIGCLVILSPFQMSAWFDVAAAAAMVWTLDALSKEEAHTDET